MNDIKKEEVVKGKVVRYESQKVSSGFLEKLFIIDEGEKRMCVSGFTTTGKEYEKLKDKYVEVSTIRKNTFLNIKQVEEISPPDLTTTDIQGDTMLSTADKIDNALNEDAYKLLRVCDLYMSGVTNIYMRCFGDYLNDPEVMKIILPHIIEAIEKTTTTLIITHEKTKM